MRPYHGVCRRHNEMLQTRSGHIEIRVFFFFVFFYPHDFVVRIEFFFFTMTIIIACLFYRTRIFRKKKFKKFEHFNVDVFLFRPTIRQSWFAICTVTPWTPRRIFSCRKSRACSSRWTAEFDFVAVWTYAIFLLCSHDSSSRRTIRPSPYRPTSSWYLSRPRKRYVSFICCISINKRKTFLLEEHSPKNRFNILVHYEATKIVPILIKITMITIIVLLFEFNVLMS